MNRVERLALPVVASLLLSACHAAGVAAGAAAPSQAPPQNPPTSVSSGAVGTGGVSDEKTRAALDEQRLRFERNRVWSDWWQLRRQADRGTIDPNDKLKMQDLEAELNQLDRALDPPIRTPGPYRDPVDQGQLLESPKNPILGR